MNVKEDRYSQGLNNKKLVEIGGIATSTTVVPVDLEVSVSGIPTRIKIPTIGVDTLIESVGLTSKGAVAVPKGPVNAGWFNLGPRPGEKGNAVIVGHYGWKDGVSAVFDNLDKLRGGDRVYVEDENGVVVTFVVRKSRVYGENEDVPEAFGLGDGKVHLNLITCGGVWNKAEKSYSTRLVVFMDRESGNDSLKISD
ncbi:MAG: class F sortase [Candidatus Paceibacterota bacterium]